MPGARYSNGRRRFVQLLGWASVIAVAPGGPTLAQVAGRSRGKSSTPAATPEPPPVALAPPVVAAPADTAVAKAPEISAEAKALAEVVRQRYGEHLSPEDLATITQDLDGDLQSIKRLRGVKLVNADEPDFRFHA